jgi:hypothetical protein
MFTSLNSEGEKEQEGKQELMVPGLSFRTVILQVYSGDTCPGAWKFLDPLQRLNWSLIVEANSMCLKKPLS